MELVSEELLKRRVSWGSVIAGVVTCTGCVPASYYPGNKSRTRYVVPKI